MGVKAAHHRRRPDRPRSVAHSQARQEIARLTRVNRRLLHTVVALAMIDVLALVIMVTLL